MRGVIIALWFGVGVLGVIDAFRHPHSDWVYADRLRGSWVLLMALLGLVFVPIYLLAVRSRFPRSGDISREFFKT